MNRKERRIAEAQGMRSGKSNLSPQSVSNDIFYKALALHQAGQLNEAENLYKIILEKQPNNARVLSLIGTIQLQRGNFEESLLFFNQAVAITPQDLETLNNRGIALSKLERHTEALTNSDRIIALSHNNANAYDSRGNILYTLHRYPEALASYDKAISLDQGNTRFYTNRGNVLNGLRRYGEALTDLNKVINSEPANSRALNNRGIALNHLKRYKDALDDFDKIITLNSVNAEVYSNRSNVLNILEDYSAALESANKAIEIKPDYAEAYNNRGTTFGYLGKTALALENYDKAIALDPQYKDAFVNRASALVTLGQYDSALASCERAIELAPEDADVNFSKATLLLLLENFSEGWKQFEWRWKLSTLQSDLPNFQKPLWLGKESVAGKTVLLRSEQGLGDTIQFCRYALLVEALQAKVILEVQPSLKHIISSMHSGITVIGRGEALPQFDYYCPLMSLPMVFETTSKTIPANVPYLFADKEKQRIWRERLGAKAKARVGLVWSGSTDHKNDRKRSMPLGTLSELLSCDMEFHCLQKDIREADKKFLSESHMINHVDNLKDFSDTAALISELDLIISVDTSVAHLAGALGKNTCVLLPYVPDYRWLLNREDSPWYPTAHLFRQKHVGDWDGVIADVKNELKNILF